METSMKTIWIGALLSAGLASSAWAALDVGEKAPDFSVPAALAGKEYKF
jgi:peroxiredoxin Q/BCP